MFEKQPKKTSKNAVLIIAGIITLLVIAFAAIIFLMATSGSNKETSQPKNSHQSETVSKNSEDNTKDSEADVDVKYIFLPSVEKTYDANGKLTKDGLFGWDYYNSPTDNKVLYIEAGVQKTYSETTMERKDNKLKISKNFFINDKLQKDFSFNSNMEYFDNTSVLIKQDITKLNGEKIANNIEVMKNQEVGNLIMLELFDKSSNMLKKIQINPNGVITERVYKNNEIYSLTEYKNYYYEGVLVATLYDVEYYINNKLYSMASYKIEKEEVIDENNVKITLVYESEKNGTKTVDYRLEYGLEKYIVENNGTVTPIDMEE